MNYSGVVAFLVCLCFFVNSSGDGIDPNCQRSTEGTEFWFGFMEGRSSSKNHYTEITVTSRLDATFQFTSAVRRILMMIDHFLCRRTVLNSSGSL